MAKLSASIEVIGDEKVLRMLETFPDFLSAAAVKAVRRTLEVIEKAQILKYTAGSAPALPPNSDYVRTFRLRGGSRKRIERPFFPVAGVWFVNNVEYDKWVLGERRQQAAVHIDRWKSLEQVAEEAEKAFERFLNAEIKEALPK